MKVSAKYIVLAVVDEEIPCAASFAEAVAYEAGLAHPVQYMGATRSVCLYLRVSVYLLRPVRRTSESLGLTYVRSFGTGSCEMLVKGGCNLRVLERRKLEHLWLTVLFLTWSALQNSFAVHEAMLWQV